MFDHHDDEKAKLLDEEIKKLKLEKTDFAVEKRNFELEKEKLEREKRKMYLEKEKLEEEKEEFEEFPSTADAVNRPAASPRSSDFSCVPLVAFKRLFTRMTANARGADQP